MRVPIHTRILAATLLAAGLAALAACGGDDAPVFRDRDPIEPAEPAVPPSPPGNPPDVLPSGADPGLGANAEARDASAAGLAGSWAATSAPRGRARG